MLRMDQQRGRPVLIEFFDVCRVNSLQTLPYVKAWHERYSGDGLRVVSVHSPGFEPSRDPAVVGDAVRRHGIEHAVLLDQDLALWNDYENAGWPARYLFDQEGMLFEAHMGEGAYRETELAIQELLGVKGREVLAPVRPEDDPEALLVAQTPDQPGAWSGQYGAGGVWAVLDGRGTVTANGTIVVDHAGVYPLVLHDHHTEGVLELDVGEGVVCHAVCFTPGLAPEAG